MLIHVYMHIYIYIHSKYSIYATFSRVTCIHYRHIHKYLNIHIIDIIYAGLYTYRYAYMYIRFQVCRLRTQKKRWRGSSCYQKPMICLVQKFKCFTFYIRDDPVDALPNPGNNGISMDLYHIIWLLFEFFHQQCGWVFLGTSVFHEVRCLPLEAAVCWDDFEGAKKHSQRCRFCFFSSL